MISQNKGVIINEIEVVGNDILSSQNVKFISGLEIGMHVNDFNIQNSVKKLWDTKRYLDVQIEISESYLNNKLTIYVKEAPFIGEIIIIGNKKVSSRKLLGKLDFKTGDILNLYKINEGINDILDHYKDKNYHQAQIEYSIDGENSQKKNIIININEGRAIKLRKIIIDGNKHFSDRKIIKNFKNTKAEKWFSPLTWGGKLNEEEYLLDKKILENFYHNQGYADFQILKDSVIYSDKEISLYLNINEGDLYYIRQIFWEGNSIKSDSLLGEVCGISRGDLFNKGKIYGDLFSKENFGMSVLESINSLYMNEGFLDFNIESVIKPVNNQDSLDIKFFITENEIFTVNNIIVSGNKKTDENVIRRELDIFPGEKFNRNKLYQSVTDLWMLNFFTDVIPKVNPISENEINLELEVVEKSVGTANFSMSYNQLHGFQGGGGFEFPNFRGKGQTVSVSYMRGLGNNYSSNQSAYPSYSNSNISQSESFSVSFFDPSIFDTPNSFGISISHTERGKNQNSLWPFDTKNSRLSLRFGRRKLKWPDRNFRISWGYSYSLDRYFSEDRDLLVDYWQRSDNSIDSYIDKEGNLYVFNTSGISLSQTIVRDSRNRPEYSTEGSKFTLTTTLAGSFLGGNHDYFKNSFDINTFSSLSEKIVLSQVFKIGALDYIGDPNNANSVVPISARYFMGGSGMSYGEMLRGYRENSIGPYQTGPTGGNLMLKYSLELRMLFSNDPTVYGFLFADMGNIWSDYDVIKLTDLKRSMGVGIRLYMPMLGVLGYDIGYGFDSTIIDDGDAHGWEHHFVFGMPIN